MSIEVDQVVKEYGAQKALNAVSFKIDSGEIVGFLGPNGAGKSTMMKIITTYIEPGSGMVYVNGFNTKKDDLEVRQSVGYLPEHNPLYLDFYVREYLNFHAVYVSFLNLKEKEPLLFYRRNITFIEEK